MHEEESFLLISQNMYLTGEYFFIVVECLVLAGIILCSLRRQKLTKYAIGSVSIKLSFSFKISHEIDGKNSRVKRSSFQEKLCIIPLN